MPDIALPLNIPTIGTLEEIDLSIVHGRYGIKWLTVLNRFPERVDGHCKFCPDYRYWYRRTQHTNEHRWELKRLD
jgi:hypothetical protein